MGGNNFLSPSLSPLSRPLVACVPVMRCSHDCCAVLCFAFTISIVIILIGGSAVEAMNRESSTPNFELVIAYGFAVLACVAVLTFICACACVKMSVGVVKVHASIENSGKYTNVRAPSLRRQFAQTPSFPPAVRLASVAAL